MKHLIKNKQNTIQKFNRKLKLHSTSSHSKHSIAPQMHTPINTNSQIIIKPVAHQSLLSRKKLPFVPQLTLSDSTANLHLNIPFALQIPLKIRKSQFASNNHTTDNSHSINNLLQKQYKCQTVKNVNTLN